MPLEILSPDLVKAVMSKNKLRQYPGAKKGRIRLLPYARPAVVTDAKIAVDATFFVVGNCFARSIEKSLTKAKKPVLSSPSDLDLPGTATQQYQRYNAFNLDVSTNEIAWAIDPNSQPMEDALICIDEEWVDMQIHWTFAHDEETAKRYRAVYNSSYSGIADADVVIVTTSGIEQWFDNECGLYLNIMPTPKMVDQDPGRYDFHRLDVEACADSLRRFCKMVIKHGKPGVQIMIAISPVSQPVVHSGNDALVDQFLAKSIQRSAADIVCTEFPQLTYLPALEATLLSDFRYGFRENSFNHTSQALTDRVVAEMLEKYQGASDGQKSLFAAGHADAMMTAGEFETSAAYIQALLDDDIALTDELEELYVRDLAKLGRQPEALTFVMDRFGTNLSENVERAFVRMMNLAKLHGTDQEVSEVIAFGKAQDFDTSVLVEVQEKRAAGLLSGGENTIAIKEIQDAVRESRYDEAITFADTILRTTDNLNPLDLQRIIAAYVQSLMQSGNQHRAVGVLLEQIETNDDPPLKWKQQLINLARTHANLAELERIWAMNEKFTQVDFDKTLARKERLLQQERISHAS